MSRTSRKICVLGLAAAIAPAWGCSSRVGGVTPAGTSEPAALAAAAPAPSGPTWDAVMPGDYGAANDELSRRDEALNLQTPGPLLASNQWPNAPRPSFERARRVHLPREARTVLEFLPPYEPAYRSR